MITVEETEIMRDTFRLLRDNSDPPKGPLDEEQEQYWKKFHFAVIDMYEKYHGHKLMREMGMALVRYLEEKQKEA